MSCRHPTIEPAVSPIDQSEPVHLAVVTWGLDQTLSSGYIAHKVHLLVACDLEWDPLEMEDGEEIRVRTFSLDEALEVTGEDYRFDPEAALALWLYTEGKS